MYTASLRRKHATNPAKAKRLEYARASGLGSKVFTTGQVARLLCVAPRTVSKWFDTGLIAGYRIPGSGVEPDRRITRDALLEFVKRNGLPMPPELLEGSRLAIGVNAGEFRQLPGDDWRFVNPVRLGVACASGPVEIALIGDEWGIREAVNLGLSIRELQPLARLVLLMSKDAPPEIDGWPGEVIRQPDGLATFAAELGKAGAA